jgi:ABC-type cobalamin transport system permease subunit
MHILDINTTTRPSLSNPAPALAGIANCGIGIALIYALQEDNLAYWVGPAAAVLGLLLFAAVPLEFVRAKVGGKVCRRVPGFAGWRRWGVAAGPASLQ